MATIYQFIAKDMAGNMVEFSQFFGKVLLIVNTASFCGFTPQLEQLQQLHETYKDKGLVVIAFPCNQFGSQDPHDIDTIGKFCQEEYGVDFLIMDKVKVNGDEAHPLFTWLKDRAGGVLGSAIKWNFTKFLVSRDGYVVRRYAPITKPEKIAGDIEKALAQSLA
mgnify:FL=1|jgi:glutathione peroxidase